MLGYSITTFVYMPNAVDILLDSDFDLPIFTGFYLGNSDKQHKRDRYISFPGFWKKTPDIGIGIGDYVKSRVNVPLLSKKIAQEAQKDSYNVESIEIRTVGGFSITEISERA